MSLVAESKLPNLSLGFWLGVLAPARTPAEVVAKLNADSNASLQDDAVKASMATLGFVPRAGTPDEFAKFLARDVKTWADIVKKAGVKTN